MPRLQDIERFKSDLATLSHEAEVLERWGEKPEQLPLPEAAEIDSSEPLSAGAGSQARPSRARPPQEDEGLPPDFAALLDTLPLEGEGEPSSIDEDLAALLGPLDEEEPSGEEPGPELESPGFESESVEEAAPEDFVMPEFDESLEALPEIPAESPEELAEAPEELTEALEAPPSEPPIDDFSIPEIGFADEVPAPAQEEDFSSVEEFSIPDLGSSLEPSREPETPAPLEEGLSLGNSELGEDAFETFSFEEPGGGFDLPSPGGASRPDLDTEIASLSEEASASDTFKLDQDWGDFGALGGGTPSEVTPRQAAPKGESTGQHASEEKFKAISLSESQVDRLQDSLLSFPLNLRVGVEDILANDRGSEAQKSKLVWALVDGMKAEDVAILAGRILKRHIPIPKGREKRTGAALEAEKGTLVYAFIHTLLPLIKVGFLVLSVAAALGYLGWRFVYIPLAADSLYREGYQRIAGDRYPEAESDFSKATVLHEYIPWYYRYAQAYTAKRQYILAEKMYASLIAAHPKEKKGILDWARLEKDQLKFEGAVEVLKGAPRSAKADAARGMTGLLSWDYFNQEGLMLLGDVYLDWAEEAPAKYEDARRTYAFLIERYGDLDIFLERMLLYFIRTDRLSEVLPLKEHFLQDPTRAALGAGVLAELGGYLLDKGMLEDLRNILLTAAKKDPAESEAHYQLARYFARAGDPTEERKALDNAIRNFAALPGLGGRRTGMYLDSLIWRGRFFAQAREWLSADRDFTAAASEYEKALELRRVKKSGRFGEAYAGLADVAYWQRDDLALALSLYQRAAANGYANAQTSYKQGNILYRTGRYKESLDRFFGASGGKTPSPYLAYAFGSALYARNDLFSAEAYFRKASQAMEEAIAADPEPAPQERPDEKEVLKLYMQSENNLGVALYRSAARAGDARRRNQAMAILAHAVKLHDQLAQVPLALEGAEPRNLGLENMNTLLSTGMGENLLVYSEIEKDMQFPARR